MSDWKVPPTAFSTLYRYYKYGYQPGGFLSAVISNDAWQAAALADPTNREALGSIILFNRYASDYQKECKRIGSNEGFDIRWESWRVRFSPHADEIEIDLDLELTDD
jgi:hypothetical protein